MNSTTQNPKGKSRQITSKHSKPRRLEVGANSRQRPHFQILSSRDLWSGLEALTNRDLGRSDTRDGLLHAVLCACAKYTFDCPDIGWEELDNILITAICNEIGDQNFSAWCRLMSKHLPTIE
jgi:hypothetical protein